MPSKYRKEYMKNWIKKKGFETYDQYSNYKKVEKLLNRYHLSERFGKDFSNDVLNECRDLITRGVRFGSRINAVLAAVTYKILREKGEPVILNEIVGLFDDVNRWDVINCFSEIYGGEKIPLPDVKRYIKKYITNLSLSEEIEKEAIRLYEEKKNILRRSLPETSAATCVYLACIEHGIGIKVKDAAKEAKITPEHLRRMIRKVRKKK
jgi:transcription initiation factor TFIIIB Brf1 subunit/transcription initiation factor TFIIB